MKSEAPDRVFLPFSGSRLGVLIIGRETSVFELFTVRTFFEIQIESDDYRFFSGALSDLNDGGDFVPGRQGLLGQKGVSLPREAHSRWMRSLSTDGLDGVPSRGACLACIVQEGDLQLAVLGDKEFGVRMHFMHYLSPIRACHCGMVVVLAMIMMLVVTGVCHGGL